MSVENLYNFRESRFTTISHELRVFIFGADVTPWLKGEMSITYGNRDSFNNCTFELSNPRKLWQVSRANIEGQWRRAAGEYCESEKEKVFRWKNSSDLNPDFNMNVSTVTLGQKDTDATNTFKPGPASLRSTDLGKERRYRLAVNDCIFSRNDPMRVFMRNPYSVKNTKGEWVEIFCGFVHDHPITTNYQTGESTLRVSGYCVRQLLTKMRVQMNRLVLQADPQPLFSRSFFADFIDPTIAKHPFAESPLEKVIKRLILGTETPVTGEAAKVQNGLGEFKLGNTICYDPRSPGTTLERWHLMTIFGVNKVPWPTGPKDDLWLTTDEMESIGRITIDIPECFSQGPGGRYLHFLLPIGGTGAGSLIESTVDNQPPRAIEWTTRWEIIREFASKLDFQVTTSPSGDILVEFPLYGFTPHVFSTKGVDPNDVLAAEKPPSFEQQQQMAAASGSSGAMEAVQKRQAYDEKQKAIVDQKFRDSQLDSLARQNEEAVAKINLDINDGVIPYGIGSLFTFNLHQIEDTLNDEAEDFPTILQVDGGFAASFNNIPEDATGVLSSLRAFVYSPVLVSRFGVVAEQMHIPYAGQKSGELSGGPKSPIAMRLSKLALIEYMKRLADSSTFDGSVVYRPFLFPNRPVWLKRSARIGLLTSVTNRWSIGKSASTSFAMHMLLYERYDPKQEKDKQTIYRLPTGAANMPIDYRNIWIDEQNNTFGHPDSGVIAVVGTAAKPTSDANGGAGAVGSGTVAPPKADTNFVASPNMRDSRLFSDKMFKPFSEAIEAAIKKAANENIKVKVVSAFRHAKYQEAMKNEPGKYGVAKDKYGNFVQVAEPWKSCHQYGLAVDVKIESGKYSDYQRFAEICGDNIYWGGAYGDYVHYEWSTQPPGKTGLQAKSFVEARKLGNDPEYYKKVWDNFDILQKMQIGIAAEPQSVFGKVMDIVGIGTRPITGTQTTTAESCTPKPLEQRGLDQIPTASKEAAAALRNT